MAKNQSMISIDLHGMTLEEAKRHVDSRINGLLHQRGKIKIRIITGKGLHSGAYGGGILAKEIHGYVASRFARYIDSIQDSPHDVSLDGVPIRGHFDVTLKT